jgi:2-methylcitrate dehydratase
MGFFFSDVLLDGQAITTSRPVRLVCDGEYSVQSGFSRLSIPRPNRGGSCPQIHPLVKDRINEVESITIITQESAMRIIDKQGPLHNPSDRDHCIQYMTAVPLLFGDLTARHYEDEVASDPRIDALRERMVCVESPEFSVDYLDPEKRSIANVSWSVSDGSSPDRHGRVSPGATQKKGGGHTTVEGKVQDKFCPDALASKQINAILNIFERSRRSRCPPVTNLVDLFVNKVRLWSFPPALARPAPIRSFHHRASTKLHPLQTPPARRLMFSAA